MVRVKLKPESRMEQNRKKKNTKTKQRIDHDGVFLKKLPGLLAICEFALIPFLVVSPIVSPEYRLEPEMREIQPLREAPVSDLISSGEVQIAATPEPPVKPKEVIQVTVTAYSSTEDQTDSTPFHTANGRPVQEGIVAANFLPLGTRLRIPEVSRDTVFTVEDRMHERFDRRLDIWMPSREAAQAFGIRYLTIEILP